MGTSRQSKMADGRSEMGRIGVRCFGVIGDWVGSRRLELEGCTVGDVLSALLGMALRPWELGDGNGGLRDGVEVLVNGRNIRFAQSAATPVREGDEVTLFLHTNWVEVPFM